MKKRIISIIMTVLLIFTHAALFSVSAGASAEALEDYLQDYLSSSTEDNQQDYSSGNRSSGSGSESVKITLTVDKQSVRKGQTFYLTYNLSNASNYDISYLSFGINYSSKDFEYCEFIANSSNHFHSGNVTASGATTNKINIEFKANPDYAYFHGQSRTASIALKMKYIGSGNMEDTIKEFTITEPVVKSEANYTYTAQDYTFGAGEVKTENASIRLTALSSDNTLAAIDIKAGGNKVNLEPNFDPNITEYTAYVEYSQGGINAKFPVNHNGATVSHNFSQKINTGSNKYYIVVTAENGSIRTYNIDMHLIPQGMTVSEYKEYLASINAPVVSEPQVEQTPDVQSPTDTEPPVEEAPIIEDIVVSPTEPSPTDTESEVKKNPGGIKGFLESLSPAVLIGALGGLIVLVAGGFTAGYVAHKKVQREKLLANYLDYYSDDYYDDGYTDYGYEDEYYEGEEYYDEY